MAVGPSVGGFRRAGPMSVAVNLQANRAYLVGVSYLDQRVVGRLEDELGSILVVCLSLGCHVGRCWRLCWRSKTRRRVCASGWMSGRTGCLASSVGRDRRVYVEIW